MTREQHQGLRLPWRAAPESGATDQATPWWCVSDAEGTLIADMLPEAVAKLIVESVNGNQGRSADRALRKIGELAAQRGGISDRDALQLLGEIERVAAEAVGSPE